MDILEALAGSPPQRGKARCKIARWLDSIPEDAEGRAALVLTFEARDRWDENYRTLLELEAIARRLGSNTSNKTIGEHRNRVCRCFW